LRRGHSCLVLFVSSVVFLAGCTLGVKSLDAPKEHARKVRTQTLRREELPITKEWVSDINFAEHRLAEQYGRRVSGGVPERDLFLQGKFLFERGIYPESAATFCDYLRSFQEGQWRLQALDYLDRISYLTRRTAPAAPYVAAEDTVLSEEEFGELSSTFEELQRHQLFTFQAALDEEEIRARMIEAEHRKAIELEKLRREVGLVPGAPRVRQVLPPLGAKIKRLPPKPPPKPPPPPPEPKKVPVEKEAEGLEPVVPEVVPGELPLPPVTEVPEVEAPAREGAMYRVKKGDCLWFIARDHYDDPFRWREIYKINMDKIVDPDLIFPNQEFLIPPLP